jgi:phosphatidate cytidylyltransferase
MLKTRIITAIILIAALLPALFMASNLIWAVIMLAVSVAAIYEWAKLIDLPQSVSVVYAVLCAALGSLLLILMMQHGFHWLFYQSLLIFAISLIFWLLMAPVLLAKYFVVQNKTLLMIIGFLLIVSLWLALIFAKGANPWLLLSLLATIWIADSAAYFAGKNFGRHKLAPSISPGKTWEGVLGALIGVTLFTAILYGSGLVTHWAVFPLLWVVTALGIIGDLFESLIKRQFNKKDSGNILPGHGGILDRIDGLLPSLPIAVLAIYLFNYFQAAS